MTSTQSNNLRVRSQGSSLATTTNLVALVISSLIFCVCCAGSYPFAPHSICHYAEAAESSTVHAVLLATADVTEPATVQDAIEGPQVVSTNSLVELTAPCADQIIWKALSPKNLSFKVKEQSTSFIFPAGPTPQIVEVWCVLLKEGKLVFLEHTVKVVVDDNPNPPITPPVPDEPKSSFVKKIQDAVRQFPEDERSKVADIYTTLAQFIENASKPVLKQGEIAIATGDKAKIFVKDSAQATLKTRWEQWRAGFNAIDKIVSEEKKIETIFEYGKVAKELGDAIRSTR